MPTVTETSVWKGELGVSPLVLFARLQKRAHTLQESPALWSTLLQCPCSHTVLFLKSRTCSVRHLLYLFTFPTFSCHYLNSSEMYVIQDTVSDTGDKEMKGSRTPADIYQMQWRTYFSTFFSKWKGQRGRKKGDLFKTDKCWVSWLDTAYLCPC